MPIMSGLAIGALIGAGVGGASAALQNKDPLKGALYGGLTGAVTGGIGGAMGGAGAGVAEGALTGGEASTFMGSGALPNSMAPAMEYGIPSLLDGGASMPLNESAQIYADTPMSGNISSEFNSLTSDPMKYLGDNKLSIGLAGLAGGMAPAKNQQNFGQDDTKYPSYQFSQTLNPQYTGAGTRYFDQNYKTLNAANGGIMSLAEGGDAEQGIAAIPAKKQPTLADYLAATRSATANARSIEVPPMQANNVVVPTMQASYVAPQQQYTRPIQQVPQGVTDYNNLLAQRAQNEYVNSPQLGAFTSHFNDAKPTAASTAASTAATANVLDENSKLSKANDGASDIPYASVYDYTNKTPTRVVNPTSGSPEFNVPSSYPVDPSSGMAETQQRYANMGFTDYIPNPHNVDGGGANGGGLMPNSLRYAMGGGIGSSYTGFDDQNNAIDGAAQFNQGPQYPMQKPQNFNDGGGIYNLGSYSDGGRLLKGPGDGVSDDIPAQIGQRQPARLADGEFVVPARIVSELGNGSTDAGAKRLYAMMDRVQANRRKTVGKGKVAVNSKSDKYLPA